METRAHLPRNVWVLGFISLLMDLSSEIYHSLLPAFITIVLGLPATAVGTIDGVAEGTANFRSIHAAALEWLDARSAGDMGWIDVRGSTRHP